MARLAIILCENAGPGPREVRLSRILDFFGVPWKTVDISDAAGLPNDLPEYAVFGSFRTVAAAFKAGKFSISNPEAVYAYADEDRAVSTCALRSFLPGEANLSLQEAPAGELLLSVDDERREVTGAMAGVKVRARLRSEEALLNRGLENQEGKFDSLLSAEGAPVFFRLQQSGAPVYFCTSAHMPDIEEPVGPRFYDVKEHFCSAVPLVMFIRFAFSEAAWKPQELGACLIIDDPLLRPQYGFCDFVHLRDLMRQHDFTTNIAFIPWNWRRTSASSSKFFRNEARLFSVSIHGCDHNGGEFGATSSDELHAKARLAQSRMRDHQARTGIRHDSIMVFPQGVFSSSCPEVLNGNGFLAAVNTEVVPVDTANARTRIRDVWDVAITTYGAFPIFTRRYAFHGLENFAFDCLLGKPCLIVAHHDYFKDGGAGLIELIEKINSLNCSLHWRPLGEVIRRACRVRSPRPGAWDVEMYGNELVIHNSSERAMDVTLHKRTGADSSVAEILCDESQSKWTSENSHLEFGSQIGAGRERRYQVLFSEQAPNWKTERSLRVKVSVAMRRLLSEFRDDYVSRSSFLSSVAARLKSAPRKAVQ